MNLTDCELLPGKVIDIEDINAGGKVRLEVPTVYESSDKNSLPWIGPLSQSSSNNYREPKNGDKVWLLFNRKDHTQSFYLPFFEMDYDTKELARTEKNVEVVVNRTTSTGNKTQIYHGETSGLVVSSEQAKMNISPEGNIDIENSGNLQISMKDGQVTIGDKESTMEPAVLGDKLKELFTQLITDLTSLKAACVGNAFTYHLEPSVTAVIDNLTSNLDNILSQNIQIN